jgi:radical SAM superfamily enzyme YgiQ (UPF0313 family)
MKIILCYPPEKKYQGYGQGTRWLPLGIASIGAYLKKQDKSLDIVLLDLFKCTENEAYFKIIEHLSEGDINIIGFTLMTEQRVSAFNICSRIKNTITWMPHGSKIITVLGGPHAYIMSDQIISKYLFVNHVIKGEGEKAFYRLVNHYKNEYPIGNEILGKTIEADMIENLDEIPHAIDGFELFDNLPDEFEEAPIIFSRGCTDYCTFCSTTKFWNGYRSRSASNVFHEMLKYYNRFGTKVFKFHDDACTADIENLKSLCKYIIEFDYNKIWKFELTARADQFDKELIKLLSETGCNKISLGIESGSERLRKLMNKKLNIDIAKKNIALIKKYKICVNLLLINGYISETDEDVKETVKLIREVKPDMICKQPLMVFPGTRIYEDLKSKKYINDSYWLEDKPQPYYPSMINGWDKINKWNVMLDKALRPINILICVPARQKENIFKLHIESLNKLKILANVSIHRLFVLHNSKNLKQYLMPSDFVLNIESDEEYKTDEKGHHWNDHNINVIASIKNQVLEMAKNYDYIFWVDSDLILHQNTLCNLIEADKDIISNIFWTRWKPEELEEEPNAWDLDTYSFFEDTKEKYRTPGTYLCGGTGACILVSTDVYKSGVNYNPIYNITFWGEDRWFSLRAVCAGYELYVDTHNPAFHIYRESYIKKAIDYIKKG